MKSKLFTTLGVIGFILLVALCGYLAVGFAGVLFSIAFIGGFILWQLTTFKTPVSPDSYIVSYIITIIFFIIHVYEEYTAHVELELTQLSGFQVSQHQFLIIAAFTAPIIWLLGAVMALKKWQFGYFLVSVFLFGMMFAELSHFISPFIQNNGRFYSAGMYTAIFPVAMGWVTFFKISKEIKRQKTSATID